ncbi:MAG: histidine phosphatase family protein [Propionibacteriaceae bacterium]|nr:histidine phosphatase family protein [Micropruina sp.]HBY24869.1 hypothetical protein [Propionibacteriaceae bacterium]
MTQKTLIVLRHAKSAWDTGDTDASRPLAARGRADAPVMGSALRDYPIDLALVSVAARTRETWQLAEAAGAKATEVRFLPELYGAWAEQVVDLLRGVSEDDATVLVVGHEPTVSELVEELAAPSALRDRAVGHFPTAGLAVLSYDGAWANLDDGDAVLERFETPRTLAS